LVTVIGYVGHAGGREETEAVVEFLADLDPKKFTVSTHAVINRDECPRLIAVRRKARPRKKEKGEVQEDVQYRYQKSETAGNRQARDAGAY
jgi:hypothetical protein